METLYDVKSRIQKKLEIADEEFLKVVNSYRKTLDDEVIFTT